MLKKNHSKDAVLAYLYKYGASSRKVIAKALNLTTASLSITTSELIKSGIIVELGEINEKKVGRKQIMVDIDPSAGIALGLELQNKKIIFVMTDLKGKILQEKTKVFNKKVTPENLDNFLEYILPLISGIREKVIGMGILVQGEVVDNRALNSPVDNIYDIITNKLDIPCIMENNTIGLVTSEFYFNESHSSFWLLRYGGGVGTAVVIDNNVLKSGHGAYIEFGHMPLLTQNSGYLCPICGRTGCLESEVHFDRVVERFEDKGYVKDDDESVFQFVMRVCETEGYSILERNMDILAGHFAAAASIIPTDEIVLSGEIFSNGYIFDYFVSRVTDKIAVPKKSISYMKNYQHKRKIAGAVTVLEKYFRL